MIVATLWQKKKKAFQRYESWWRNRPSLCVIEDTKVC